MSETRRLGVRKHARRRAGIPIVIVVNNDGTAAANYDEKAPFVRFDALSEVLDLHGLTEADLEEMKPRRTI